MRLTQVTIWGDTTIYAYNGDGDRISQTVNGVTTTYVIDTATPLTMVLAETTNGNTIRYWHGLDVIGQSDGITTEYFGYDGLGSVRQLNDAGGSVGLAQTFDPYGNTYSRTGTQSTNFGYTGEYQDENGLLFLRARYYAASMGRFVNTDPSRQERNPYQYAMGNPILFTDPSGLDPNWCEQITNPAEKRACYANASGKVPIPLVDETTGRFTQEYVDDWYGLRKHLSETIWLDAQGRRQKAVEQAQKWAIKDPGNLPWGDTTPPQSLAAGCNDCIMFVSYVLWRAGFTMTGVTFNNGVPIYSAYETGWWAKGVNSARTPGSSADFQTVDHFLAEWTGKKGYPARAYETDDLSSLEPGDVILYQWVGATAHTWDHAAIVVQKGASTVGHK
jgi:RHS repeat-associated protein